MASIRSKNTLPELAVRKELWKEGFRYRLHYKVLPGKPDIVFPNKKLAVFINGCFWHNHSCIGGRVPRTNTKFWKTKIEMNVRRDELNYQKLKEMGWKVLTLWECEINLNLVKQVNKVRSCLVN